MRPRWFFLALIVAVLDRLAPKLERAQMLPAETRDAIKQLVERARVSTGDARYDVRRSVTIERVTEAIKARDGGGPALSSSVGQSPRPE
jgi:hypothetical protein